MSFEGKNVFVTGGANGIGWAISQAMAAAKASLWILDLAAENPTAAAQSIGAHACAADVADRPSLENAFANLPVPDVVVVNAGIVRNCLIVGHNSGHLESNTGR